MDKETLSNYGWIVILVLILAVMIALATPFGNFIAEGFKAAYMGFFDTGESALGVVIPGAETSTPTKDPALNPDDGTGISDEMVYTTENYEYRYNQYYNTNGGKWYSDTSQNGWGVRCVNNVADPGPILESINGEPVTNMMFTFADCTALTTAPAIPNSVTNMTYTFQNCTALTTAPIIPSSVTNMMCTFDGCTALTTAPAIPSSVTNMFGTFRNCTSLKTYAGSTDPDGDFSGYVIPDSVTDMGSTFYMCRSMVTAPAIPSNVWDIRFIFYYCTKLTTAPDMSNATSLEAIGSALCGCTSLKTYAGSTDPDGDFSGYVIPDSVTSMNITFEGCSKLKIAPVIPNNVRDMTRTFSNCYALTTAPVIPSSVIYMSTTFYGCSNLKTYHGSTDPDGDFSGYIIPSRVTDIDYTFRNCTSLTNAPDMSNATNVGSMEESFYNCTSLTTAPVIPDSVTDMTYTFYNCTSLTTAPVIPSRVTNMSYTFYKCTSLTTAPVIPSRVTDMTYTFYNCTSLTGTITINANPTSYSFCFNNNVDFDTQNITLAGECDVLDELGASGLNYCSECNGKCCNIEVHKPNCEHTGGEASCTQLAICELCGKEYGGFVHNYNTSVDCQTEITCILCGAKIGLKGSHNYVDGTCTVCGGSQSTGCFAEGTLITLADGTQKPIEQVTYDDELLVWDFYNGTYTTSVASLIETGEFKNHNVLHLQFSDGTVVRVIDHHGFYNVQENDFVFIDENNVKTYIGLDFIKTTDQTSNEYVELVDYYVTVEDVTFYTVLTAIHNNCIAEKMLTLTPPPIGLDGWFDIFEISKDMRYDTELMHTEIEKYGLYTYDDFDEYMTYEQFMAFNGPYLKILVGRGTITHEQILDAINAFAEIIATQQ